MSEIPVINASPLRAADLGGRAAVAEQLGRACREVGFFYVAGHGISDSIRAGVFAAARRFFAQPLAAKAELSMSRSPNNRGYAAIGTERLDDRIAPDQKEAFNIGLDLSPDDPEVLAGKPFRGLNMWPALPGWRETVLTYYNECQRLQLELHRGIALDLGLPESFFDDKLDRPISTLRMLHYPAGQADAGELGAGTHTDFGNLTILATDGVAGLQVQRRDGVWLDAPEIPGTFVCNIGDCLMRWTNDVYVSTPHRVQRPASERYSIAFFADANPEAMVQAIPSCVPPGATAKYRPIASAAYLRQRLNATSEHETVRTGAMA